MLKFLAAVLRAQHEAAGISKGEFAQRFGRDYTTIWRVLEGKTKGPQEGWDDFVTKFCQALEIDPQAVWADALEQWRADPKGKTLLQLRSD